MRKTLITLTALAAIFGAGVTTAHAAEAREATAMVQPVQYYGGPVQFYRGAEWGEDRREEWRHERAEEWRHREWERRREWERWHHEHDRRW